MSRPTGTNDWGQSAGSSSLVQPSLDQRARGWSAGARLPAPYLNNWMAGKDTWDRYLDRRALMGVVVEDDFARSQNWAGYGVGFSAYDFSPSYVVLDHTYRADGSAGVALVTNAGIIAAGLSPSGQTGYLRTFVGEVGRYDFLIDAVARSPGIGSGHSIQIGLLDNLAFFATGPTGPLGLNYRPSGMTPTQVSFSGYYPTAYHRMTADHESGTVEVRIDNTQVALISGVVLGPTNYAFGAQIHMPRQAANSIVLDSIALKVKR
jgi:hypothetical protein